MKIYANEIPRKPETVVVVPCFNEARRLNPVAYSEFLASHSDIAILFVDDGSTDDTPLVVERLRQQFPRQICTLRLEKNIGKAEAVRRGVQVALRKQPTIVGFWDADLATPLETIPQFRQVFETRPHVRLVMGSRVAMMGRQIRRRGARHFLGRVFATAASIVLRLPVYDTQCGAKLFRVTPEVTMLFDDPFGSRWVFDVEILARMMARARRREVCRSVYEVPLDKWEDVAGSRLRPRDFLAATRDLVTIYLRYVRNRKKLAMPARGRHSSSNSDQQRAA